MTRLIASDGLEGREDGGLGDPQRAKALGRSAFARHDAQEDMLGGDVFVLQGRGFRLGFRHRDGRIGRKIELGTFAEYLGLLG